jgi:hypothetical protein
MNEQLLLALKNFAAAANVLNSYWTHANDSVRHFRYRQSLLAT